MTAIPSPPAARGWRLLPLETAPPRSLIARGLELLESLAGDPRPTLRWYRSTGTAIVLGRGQRLPDSALPVRPAGGTGVEVLTRHSGGGAVLLDPSLLSLDVIVPPDHPLVTGDLTAAFDRIGRAWCDALTSLGVEGLEVHTGSSTARRRGTQRERLLAAVCYATLGHGEVVARGRKVVGLAQRRRRHGALVQCGLLHRWKPGPLLAALGADPDDAEVAAAAAGLEDLGHGDLADDAVMVAVSAALGAGYDVEMDDREPTREEPA